MSGNKVYFYDVLANESGQRIDNFLFKKLKGVPKSRIYKGLRKGEFRVGTKRIKPDYKLKEEDKIRMPPLSCSAKKDIDASLMESLGSRMSDSIIYENDDFLLCNKPSGIAVHSGSGVIAGVIESLRYFRQDLDYLELGHRIDKGTSGCLLLFKSRESLLEFHRMLLASEVKKTYLCLVHGSWPDSIGRYDKSLKISEYDERRKVRADPEGKRAISIFKIKKRYKTTTLLEVELVTGRTHQIRVHAADAGFPIVGDHRYGDDKNEGGCRLMLHAHSLIFSWKPSSHMHVLEAKLPEEFLNCVKKIENTIV
ncbi:MAG: RluA family pseudouridine synthase [Legionellales bacterium]|jgi:23S rRNA pseudouridine955/2504/2580 synthase|nr:RluA family pseudouridine synthase [Legionellales bacterium]